MKTIGDRIREERENQGMTQDELAKRLNYAHRSAVNKLEHKTKLTTDKVQLVADALGVPVSRLMGWEDEENEYYENDETSDLAQRIKDNHQLKALLAIQSDMEPEDLDAIFQMAIALKRKAKE